MTQPAPGTGSDSCRKHTFFGGAAELIRLTEYVDKRGALLPLDFIKMPFRPRRVFVTHDVPAGTTRGGHAHKQESQLLVRLTGRIQVVMRFEKQREICVLHQSDTGLLIGPGIWSEQVYLEPATTLLVLARTPYDPASYLVDSE